MPLDLFLHSADVTLRNAVIATLCARDAEAMRVAMDRLLAEFPNDLNNDDFELLFSELSALSQQAGSASAIAQRVERIETHWRPALQKTIGTDAAQHWIEAVYGQLAHAASDQAFTRSLAQAHVGGLFLRANELAQARVAVVAIPSWRRIPEALAWMTEIALPRISPTSTGRWLPNWRGSHRPCSPLCSPPEPIAQLQLPFCATTVNFVPRPRRMVKAMSSHGYPPGY